MSDERQADGTVPRRAAPSATSRIVQTLRPGWQPASPARRPVLFVNPRSGGATARRARIAERARERGIEAVVMQPGQNLSKLLGEAVAGGADALGMAGGDGSLAVVAEAARRHGLPFVCIPAGTRNHFAADLGIRRGDPIGALGILTWRSTGTRYVTRSGRRRPASGFSSPLTTAEVRATEPKPSTAARRPRVPHERPDLPLQCGFGL